MIKLTIIFSVLTTILFSAAALSSMAEAHVRVLPSAKTEALRATDLCHFKNLKTNAE